MNDKTAEIVKLETVHVADVNDELVERLENLLDMAKSGELQCLAYAGARRRDRAMMTGWSKLPKPYGIVLSAALYTLFHRFGKAVLLEQFHELD